MKRVRRDEEHLARAEDDLAGLGFGPGAALGSLGSRLRSSLGSSLEPRPAASPLAAWAWARCAVGVGVVAVDAKIVLGLPRLLVRAGEHLRKAVHARRVSSQQQAHHFVGRPPQLPTPRKEKGTVQGWRSGEATPIRAPACTWPGWW